MPRSAIGVLLVLIAIGAAMRSAGLDDRPLWVDEAESSINALTILQTGVPRDSYLGVPLFENTLVQTWPESEEYEFKDLSYSDRGLAVYHGWLPLYSIAASLKAFGIEPDQQELPLKPRHDAHARLKRTIAARVPSVVFGVLALVVLFHAGTALFNWQAGLCAAALGSVWSINVELGQQARYYSATVLLSASCGWLTWRMVSRKGWKDHIWGALAFAGLFHTHLISFVVAVALYACCASLVLRSRDMWLKASVFGALLASFCLPWLLLTGFLEQSERIPKAWRLFSFPSDLFPGSVLFVAYGALFGAGLVIVLTGLRRVRARWIAAILAWLKARGHAVGFLYLWLAIGYTAFWLMPAVSFWPYRMGVVLLAPIILLAACLITALAQALWPSRPAVAAVALGMICAVASDAIRPKWTGVEASAAQADLTAVLDFLASEPILDDTRLYAIPNEQMVLMFYSGLPVQSIAPVRKRFLDSYPGNILLFEKLEVLKSSSDPAHPDNVMRLAKSAGISLTSPEAVRISWAIAAEEERKRLQGQVAHIAAGSQDVPPFARPLIDAHRQFVAEEWSQITRGLRRKLMFRGFEIRSSYDWWSVYFYRFADPIRRHDNPVYADRLRNATAHFLQANWVIYHSPGSNSGTAAAHPTLGVQASGR